MVAKKKVSKKKVAKKAPIKKKKAAKKKAATVKVPKKVRKVDSRIPINTPEHYNFGRPCEYKREYCQIIYEACKSGEARTVADMCCLLEIARETLHDWMKKHTDFSDAIKRGMEFRIKRMEKDGFSGMWAGKQFNGVPWLFLVKNMFPEIYNDRQDNNKKDDGDNKKKESSFNFNLSKTPDQVDEEHGGFDE